MRNRILLLISAALLTVNFSFAQQCGTYDGSLERDILKYSDFYQSLESINTELKIEKQKAEDDMKQLKTESGKKIIPVVVHVIHNGGGENLTVDQIQNGIDELNKNINGQADNFLTVTPDVFAAARGDLNVEFRLAKKDPLGNPTNGIVRVQSELTVATVTANLSRNRVKALSYWTSFQYFNIWVVQSMPAGPDPQADPALNGYAQFPNSGRMSTDGVMIRSGVFAVGETITHEVGHWLGLRHTWGDAECGSDNISDTPSDLQGTFDYNGVFPFNVGACEADSLNPAGEMYMNYMDYQADAIQSMFTKGQGLAMNETLEGVYDAETNETDIGYREYMWSPENLAATGTSDGYVPSFCAQNADFTSSSGFSSICEGEQIVLKGNKTQIGNNNVTSMLWDFGDGEIDNSSSNQIMHSYSSVGSYNVTLIVEYNETIEIQASDSSILNGGIVTYNEVNHMVQGRFSELDSMGAINITEIQLDSLALYLGMEDSSFFRGYIKKGVYTATYNNTCTDTVTKIGFVNVKSTSSSSSSSSYSYSFENESDLNGDWVVSQLSTNENQWNFNLENNNTEWQWESGIIASEGTSQSSLKVDGEGMQVGAITELVSKAYDLSFFTELAIKFSWSGAAVNTFPVNELRLYFSKNCGEDWLSLGTLNKFQSSNAGLYATNFSPESYEWNDTIMTKSQLIGENNIRFKFAYIVNGSSNNFYLDNIMIGESVSLLVTENSTNARLSVFPNPASENATIILDNIFDENIEITLFNILGAQVCKLFSGVVQSKHQEISADLTKYEKGIYFIKVESNTDVILTNKLLIE
jgi:hypothetical protein